MLAWPCLVMTVEQEKKWLLWFQSEETFYVSLHRSDSFIGYTMSICWVGRSLSHRRYRESRNKPDLQPSCLAICKPVHENTIFVVNCWDPGDVCSTTTSQQNLTNTLPTFHFANFEVYRKMKEEWNEYLYALHWNSTIVNILYFLSISFLGTTEIKL